MHLINSMHIMRYSSLCFLQLPMPDILSRFNLPSRSYLPKLCSKLWKLRDNRNNLHILQRPLSPFQQRMPKQLSGKLLQLHWNLRHLHDHLHILQFSNHLRQLFKWKVPQQWTVHNFLPHWNLPRQCQQLVHSLQWQLQYLCRISQ